MTVDDVVSLFSLISPVTSLSKNCPNYWIIKAFMKISIKTLYDGIHRIGKMLKITMTLTIIKMIAIAMTVTIDRSKNYNC